MAHLKIGLAASSIASLEPWELRLLDLICADDRFQLTTIVTNATAEPLKRSDRSIGDRIFALDKKWIAGPQRHVASAFEAALPHAQTLQLSKNSGDNSTALATLAGLQLDVVLVHGLDGAVRELGQHSKFGAWSLQFAGERMQTRSCAQALKCLDCGPLATVELTTTIAKASPRMVAVAAFNTERTPATTLVRTAEKSVSLILRSLRRLAANGVLEMDVANHSTQLSAGPPASAGRYAKSLAQKAGSRAAKVFAQSAGRHLMRWSLFLGHGKLDGSALEQTHEIRPAPGQFWADPFLFEKNGEIFVFFENYVYASGLGKISVGIYRDGQLEVLGDALDLGYHLSFPGIFAHGGDIFMLPETSGPKRVEVWRAVEFPLKWERFSTALEGQSVADPVLVRDEGKWWLFANISTTPFDDHCNELHIFEVDGPALTRITPHPRNPVVIGADTARNAGRIVRRDGKLVRMSQNNSHGVYGYGLNVMEITRLDALHYEETCILSIEPGFKPQLIGCHHFDRCGEIFVVDGCRSFG